MKNGKTRSLHWWISVALIAFGLLMAGSLTLQSYRSQGLVEHRIWRHILESVALTYAEQRAMDPDVPLPRVGILRSWLVHDGVPTPGMPPFLESLAPGYYSSDSWSSLDLEYPFQYLITLLVPFNIPAFVFYIEPFGRLYYDPLSIFSQGIRIILLLGWLS